MKSVPEFKNGDYISVQGSLRYYKNLKRVAAAKSIYWSGVNDGFINNAHILLLSIGSYYYEVLFNSKVVYVSNKDFEHAALIVIS